MSGAFRLSVLAVIGVDTIAFPSIVAEATLGGLKLRTDEAVPMLVH